MSVSAAKLYVLNVLAGGAEGKSCYGAKALREAIGLANATIYKARQELINMGLITIQKEMVHGCRNKKPKIWVELQDLPINRLEVKKRRSLPLPANRVVIPAQMGIHHFKINFHLTQSGKRESIHSILAT